MTASSTSGRENRLGTPDWVIALTKAHVPSNASPTAYSSPTVGSRILKNELRELPAPLTVAGGPPAGPSSLTLSGCGAALACDPAPEGSGEGSWKRTR